jgi:hypothetical protein
MKDRPFALLVHPVVSVPLHAVTCVWWERDVLKVDVAGQDVPFSVDRALEGPWLEVSGLPEKKEART